MLYDNIKRTMDTCYQKADELWACGRYHNIVLNRKADGFGRIYVYSKRANCPQGTANLLQPSSTLAFCRHRQKIARRDFMKISDLHDIVRRAHDALDNASGVVDPGEDENMAYEGELVELEQLLAHLEKLQPKRKEAA